jgi:hypothetical protein
VTGQRSNQLNYVPLMLQNRSVALPVFLLRLAALKSGEPARLSPSRSSNCSNNSVQRTAYSEQENQ